MNAVITGDMVKRWLEEANAPGPWDLTALDQIAATFDSLRLQAPHRRKAISEKSRINAVQTKVSELRRALTSFLSSADFRREEEFWAGKTGGAAADFQRRAADARNMLTSLKDVGGSHRPNAVWVELARDAYQCFQILVPSPLPNKANRHEGNPASAFVSKAVLAMGETPRDAKHLESILIGRTTAADKYEKQHGLAVERPVPFRKSDA